VFQQAAEKPEYEAARSDAVGVSEDTPQRGATTATQESGFSAAC
jgi:hypothetical protein